MYHFVSFFTPFVLGIKKGDVHPLLNPLNMEFLLFDFNRKPDVHVGVARSFAAILDSRLVFQNHLKAGVAA